MIAAVLLIVCAGCGSSHPKTPYDLGHAYGQNSASSQSNPTCMEKAIALYPLPPHGLTKKEWQFVQGCLDGLNGK